MLSVSLEVVMRYFLGRPTVWVLEIAQLGLVYVPFLGAAWLLRREGHVKMDVVLNQLKPRAQSLVNAITSIVGAITCLVIAWFSAQMTWEYFQLDYTSPTGLRIPTAPILVIVPVGVYLLSIQFLRRSNGYLGMWKAGGEY